MWIMRLGPAGAIPAVMASICSGAVSGASARTSAATSCRSARLLPDSRTRTWSARTAMLISPGEPVPAVTQGPAAVWASASSSSLPGAPGVPPASRWLHRVLLSAVTVIRSSVRPAAPASRPGCACPSSQIQYATPSSMLNRNSRTASLDSVPCSTHAVVSGSSTARAGNPWRDGESRPGRCQCRKGT